MSGIPPPCVLARKLESLTGATWTPPNRPKGKETLSNASTAELRLPLRHGASGLADLCPANLTYLNLRSTLCANSAHYTDYLSLLLPAPTTHPKLDAAIVSTTAGSRHCSVDPSLLSLETGPPSLLCHLFQSPPSVRRPWMLLAFVAGGTKGKHVEVSSGLTQDEQLPTVSREVLHRRAGRDLPSDEPSQPSRRKISRRTTETIAIDSVLELWWGLSEGGSLHGLTTEFRYTERRLREGDGAAASPSMPDYAVIAK